jgi:pimeloyl-ACP methyl ester carboxylesterase
MRLNEVEVEHGTVEVGGAGLHYVARGAGPLVVLLHGFPETWWSWRYQLEPLARAGFRVVAPDLRGFGDSTTGGARDVDTLADDVAALLDALGAPRATIVGHDWGGAVAWQFAGRYPARCARLAALNCPHPAAFARALALRPRQLARSWYMFFFLVPGVSDRALTRDDGRRLRALWRRSSVDPRNFSDDEIEPMVQAALRPGAIASMLAIYRANLTRAFREPRAVLAAPPAITAPSMLVWGRDDPALGYDELVPATQGYAPGLRVVAVDRCGHFVQSERPDEVNRALIEHLRRDGA